jgi:hypothetical protein
MHIDPSQFDDLSSYWGQLTQCLPEGGQRAGVVTTMPP